MNLPSISILYEDDDLSVINKPVGMVVNRAQSVKGETVQEWVEKKLSALSFQPSAKTNETQDFYSRAGIVHRIDKETSGCLIIAKNPTAFTELQRQFKERVVKKTYLALVHGKLEPEQGEIQAPVGRLPWNRERFGVVPGGRDAVTKYKVFSVFSFRFSDNGLPDSEVFSLVELSPETGRTHQIRVHLKYVGHPIVGDYLYAGRKTSRSDREWAPRVMLHARSISFRHPTTGVVLAIEAPIPDDMGRIIK